MVVSVLLMIVEFEVVSLVIFEFVVVELEGDVVTIVRLS